MLEKKEKRKYGLEDKLQVVELRKQGYGYKLISSKLSIDRSLIRRWLNIYKDRGVEGFTNVTPVQVTPEKKLEIVKEVLEHQLSFNAASLLCHVRPSTVSAWVKKVKQHGYSSLAGKTQSGQAEGIMGRPKKKEPETELEKVKAELDYYKAENAYLKKLAALVEERVNRESGKKLKPSNH